jgi:hypothetical protein
MSPGESSMNIEDFELDDADPITPLNDKGYCIAFVPSDETHVVLQVGDGIVYEVKWGPLEDCEAFVADLEKGACLERAGETLN